MNSKLFSRDFTLVIVGQIISLLGNAIISFALPLYLLNQTGSSTLFGTVTAFAIIPSIILSPVGGLIADRVNKRNIMVALDFFTAVLVLGFSQLVHQVSLVPLMTVTLMLLYGISSTYHPAVQASIPALVNKDQYMQANSVVNTIGSLSRMIGPVLGGMLYSVYGLDPILWFAAACFFLSAVMEVFIRMPHTRQDRTGSILNTVKSDFQLSLRFIRFDKPVLIRVQIIICGINLFLSAMISVSTPYLITEVLPFESGLANKLFGFSQSAFALGGLAGGICAGLLAKKLMIHRAGNLLILSALLVFPMGFTLLFFSQSGWINYTAILVGCFFLMIFATLFSVQMMSFIQTETPQHLIGKVLAVSAVFSQCAQPLGTAMYGVLFDLFKGAEYAVIFFAAIASLLIAIITRSTFKGLRNAPEAAAEN